MQNPVSFSDFYWVRPPQQCTVTPERVTIQTPPGTDLWQRTYYGFQNDNAPVLLVKTREPYFTFQVSVEVESAHRFDQGGIVLYQDSENWLKASMEYENDQFQRLGSVVTNHGYSDWASMDVDASVKSLVYRLSRRESDYCVEYSLDGTAFHQMRVCHLWEGAREIRFGVYACSPEQSSFRAVFHQMKFTQCLWASHK